MRKFFDSPLCELYKLIARLAMACAAAWALQDEHEATLEVTFCVAVALTLSPAFFSWDWQGKMNFFRFHLYSLNFVGQAVVQCGVALVILSAYRNQATWVYAGGIALVTGYAVSLYASVVVFQLHKAEQKQRKELGIEDEDAPSGE